MSSFLDSLVPSARGFGRRMLRAASPLLAFSALSIPLLAQDTPPTPPAPGATDQPQSKEDRRAQRRAGFTPEAMLAALKDQLGVTDDAEWALISARLTAMMDVRRTMGGGFGGRPGGGGGGGGNTSRGGSPEADALRQAVADKMPDAEIKARLDRFREVRKQNQAKLDKAQEDLRAVLTVRQEAFLVSRGLLP